MGKPCSTRASERHARAGPKAGSIGYSAITSRHAMRLESRAGDSDRSGRQYPYRVTHEVSKPPVDTWPSHDIASATTFNSVYWNIWATNVFVNGNPSFEAVPTVFSIQASATIT